MISWLWWDNPDCFDRLKSTGCSTECFFDLFVIANKCLKVPIQYIDRVNRINLNVCDSGIWVENFFNLMDFPYNNSGFEFSHIEHRFILSKISSERRRFWLKILSAVINTVIRCYLSGMISNLHKCLTVLKALSQIAGVNQGKQKSEDNSLGDSSNCFQPVRTLPTFIISRQPDDKELIDWLPTGWNLSPCWQLTCRNLARTLAKTETRGSVTLQFFLPKRRRNQQMIDNSYNIRPSQRHPFMSKKLPV